MIALYERVSTDRQAEQGNSIPEQKDRLEKFCHAFGWKDYVHYTDAGFTGAKRDRPALNKLIKDIEKGKVNKVLVYKLDRLSRSQKDTLWLIEDKMLSNGCDFISISENFDTSTPFGRAMIGILAVFAQLEREQIKERMNMGKIGRAKDGKRNGGGCPVGYDYINGKLIVNEYEAMQIREIHRMYQEGYSIKLIVRTLRSKGYSHKYGQWIENRVRSSLLNKLYIGKISYNGIFYDGEQEPIIDEDTYNRSYAIWQSHDYSSNKKTGKHSYLCGLIFCAQCTARYGLQTSRYKGKIYNYYRCYSQRITNVTMVKDENCKNRTYRMTELDDIIFNEIKKLSVDPDGVSQLIEKKEDNAGKIKLLRKEIAKVENQRSRFMDLYGLGSFTLDEIQGKIEPLNVQLSNLEKEISSLENDKALPEKEAVQLLSSWDDVLNSGDHDMIKSLIDALIERIDIDGEDITIHWRFT